MLTFAGADILVSSNVSRVMVDTGYCRPCPLGATCELGGNSVVPLPGYWISPVAGSERREDQQAGRKVESGSVVGSTDVQITLYKCLPGNEWEKCDCCIQFYDKDFVYTTFSAQLIQCINLDFA